MTVCNVKFLSTLLNNRNASKTTQDKPSTTTTKVLQGSLNTMTLNGPSTHHTQATTVGSTSSSSSSSGVKSAALMAMEKTVIDKGNVMNFKENRHSDGKVR